jgi:AraC-like DNA-binding protein
MQWSLPEYLDRLDLRGQSWCFVNMGARSGFHLPHSEAVVFHAVLEGTVILTSGVGQSFEMKAGDVAIVISGGAHKIHNHPGTEFEQIELLNSGNYVDSPSIVEVGTEYPVSRLLCGRLKLFWPGGSIPGRIPSVFACRASDVGVDLPKFANFATRPGGTAILSQLAALLFTSAFRDNRACRAQFQWQLDDPIARAQVLIKRHPFDHWTVQRLADTVGLSRSHFAARFVTQMGQSPIEALTAERMKHAQNLLRGTGLPIGEVSRRLGYRSEPTFIRRFTSYFGVTPDKFRMRDDHAQH